MPRPPLFQWLEVSDRCPLCKIVVSCVLYDIKSPKDYKTHVHAPGGDGNPEGSLSSPLATARASLRGEQGEAAGGGGSSWAARGAEFRSVVYRRGLVAEPPEDKARLVVSDTYLTTSKSRKQRQAFNHNWRK